MLDGKSFPNFHHTPYVCNMCSGATLATSGHFLSMKPIGKKFHPIYKLFGWTYQGMPIIGAHGHDGEPIFFQKPSAFDCGTNVLCGGSAWGSSWWEDSFKFMKGQCVSILTKYICGGKSIGSSRKSSNSYNSSFDS